MGRAYRDDNIKGVRDFVTEPGLTINITNGLYDIGEFQQPRAGTDACVPGGGCKGDGIWGAADVRRQATIVFATGTPRIVADVTTSAIGVVLTDSNPNNNNSLPTGSTVTAIALDLTKDNNKICAIAGENQIKILNTLEATFAKFGFTQCDLGDAVTIKVVTPLGTTTSITYPIQ